MEAQVAVEALKAIDQGIAVDVPLELAHLKPSSKLSGEIRAATPLEVILSLSNKLLAGEVTSTIGGAVLALLHDCANVARAEQRHEDAKAYFTRILRHSPHDYNVRVALAAYRDPNREQRAILEVLDPALPTLLAHPVAYKQALTLYAQSAFKLGDLGAALKVGKHLNEMAAGPGDIAVVERIKLLLAFGGDAHLAGEASTADGVIDSLVQACLSLDEFHLTEQLGVARTVATRAGSSTPAKAADLALIAAAIAHRRRWNRPYRIALDLVASQLAEGFELNVLRTRWRELGLPAAAIEPMLLVARARAGVTALFEQEPEVRVAVERAKRLSIKKSIAKRLLGSAMGEVSLDAARSAWAEAYLAGNFDPLLRHAPSGAPHDREAVNEDLLAPAIASALAWREVPATPAAASDLWIVITWHQDVESLSRQVSALRDERTSVVVSIGGHELPEDLGRASALLLVDRFTFTFNPVVTWGGPKLLFHNVFKVLGDFVKRAPESARLQVICNRTYPLLPPREMTQLLADPDFARQHPGSQPPPAWRREWPDEIVDDLPAVFDRMMDDIFESCNATSLRTLLTMPGAYDTTDFRLNGTAFNFAPRAVTLDGNFKDMPHHYSISSHAADMRWMSFGRLTEFVDVSSEAAATFSRRLHPMVARWVHSVLDKHQLKTGDPFINVTHKFARTVQEHPGCVELFAAMNGGFAPEMNYFDTVANSPQYALEGHLQHLYYRGGPYFAVTEAIPGASHAADVDRYFFIRKTSVDSGPFIQNFAERIAADWSADRYYLAIAGEKTPGAPTATVPRLQGELGDRLVGLPCRLRDMFGRTLAEAVLEANGKLTSGGESLADWRWTDGALEIDFATVEWGAKRYEQFTTEGTIITLPPAEIVSVRNKWSVFLDFTLADVCQPRRAAEEVTVISPRMAASTLKSGRTWHGAALSDIAVLAAFEDVDTPHFPGPGAKHVGETIALRKSGSVLLALAEVDGFPALNRITGAQYANSRAAVILKRAYGDDMALWESGEAVAPGSLDLGLAASRLHRRFVIETLSASLEIELTADQRIRDRDGQVIGGWFASAGQVWLLGIPGVSVALASQFGLEEDRWRLSGWAWSNLKDLNTFSAREI